MSRNGWIACVIAVVVMLCVGVLCFMLAFGGVLGYLLIHPSTTLRVPIQPEQSATLTPTPIVVRPVLPDPTGTPSSPLQAAVPPVVTPQANPTTPSSPTELPADTLALLENTFIPINDPLDLAHRLLHMNNLSPTEPPPVSFYEVGAHETFWAGDGEGDNFRIQVTLKYVTDHAYFWIEDGVHFHQRDLINLADSFENQIYPTDREFFGSEWTPGVDGDPHIYIVYARGIGENNAGYFSSADEYPHQINMYSNAHEMFLINADNSPLYDEYTYGVLAHELQHMIHWYQDRNEANWVSEGFSELAVLLNDFYTGGFDALYTSNPDIQLNDWPDDSKEDTTPHYGASFLFLTYFLDRFGDAATKDLIANQYDDLSGVDKTLQHINAIDPITGNPINADNFFLDWAITNYLMNPQVGDGRFSYSRYKGTPRAEATETFDSCPVDINTRDVHQYGVDYIRFTCPGSYNLHFEGSIQTPLLPQDPHSGSYAFWSNKNDESDTTLTRTFDLTDSKAPLSLSYWTWYELENGWDYVYLEASTDGLNWHILNTPSGTANNPQGNSYGWGYTGTSGGKATPEWIQENVDISQFAGQTLVLRFEYITDSNVTGEGYMLDDISIPEIGYSSDFEKDIGGWQAEGWVRIQNVLPQRYQLALISIGSDTTVQTITLGSDVTADIPFVIGDGVDSVVFVVSGTTRFTRQLAPYRYIVSQP